jgi:hypothetical protein
MKRRTGTLNYRHEGRIANSSRNPGAARFRSRKKSKKLYPCAYKCWSCRVTYIPYKAPKSVVEYKSTPKVMSLASSG